MQILKQLIHYATLAPSSHNTQCWKFRIDENQSGITILPDFTRRCPVVDPDDHHLYLSLGCAVENLIIAAEAHGFSTRVNTDVPESGIHLSLTKDREDTDTPTLFDAIEVRQSNRGNYDGKEVSSQDLRVLQEAGQGKGVSMRILTEPSDMETIKDFICQANSVQLKDTLFKEELKSWVRFNGKEAKENGDGLFGKCMGHPSAPRWIGGMIFDYGVTEKKENKKIRNAIDSSAGIAVIVSEQDDPAHWIEAGRCYERFALTATSLGIHNAHLNQPVEVQEIRPAFAKALGLPKGSRPDLVLRFGRGSRLPMSFRRPLEDVLQE